jgi:hypothetical protein
MLKPLLNLYELLLNNRGKFENYNLNGDFFVDVYRSQPMEPEMYEYFSVPAIFVDYQMQGLGKDKPRLITMILHIITDEMPNASNISEDKERGMNRWIYCLLLQSILEGARLGKTTPLKFISENPVDAPVINYHTQTYEFETYMQDMVDNAEYIFGEFERLNIFGNLKTK